MTQIEETEGIILSVRNYRENDRLVKIFTDRFGKRMFFVKGTRRPNSPLKSAIVPFTKGSYIIDFRKEGLCFIRDAKDLTHFQSMQNDIFLNAYATYCLNLADAALEDNVTDSALFQKLERVLTEIDEGTDPEIIVNIFEVQLLDYFGVAPEWRGCRICGTTDGTFDYSGIHGGLLCKDHWELDKNRYHADQKALYFLRLFSIVSFDKIGTISIKDENKREIRRLIDMIYDETVGIKLKSKRFIDQMYSWGDLLLKDERKNQNEKKE